MVAALTHRARTLELVRAALVQPPAGIRRRDTARRAA